MMAMLPKKTNKPRYVLLIEDNPHHAELLTEILDHHFAPVIIHTVDTIEDGIEFAGQSNYDVVLTGALIHDVSVLDFVPSLTQASGGAPIIVISGRGNERLAAELIKKGASEYLVKTRETLESLPALLQRYFSKKRTQPQQKNKTGKKTPKERSGATSPAAIIREVDRLTQQALLISGPRRRKSRLPSSDLEHLDNLLGQIQKLRAMAAKLAPKG